jgi:checkpoint serine/threonine-protein kinase
VQFIADWKTGPQDCAEMRELRPWTYQIDYHGLAGIIHSMLFGKYIDTIAEKGSGLGAASKGKWRIKEGLKRYWQTEIWGEAFNMLLNPGLHVEGEEGAKMPILKGMREVRERMETWLEGNSERGMGLQPAIRKLEWAIREKRR